MTAVTYTHEDGIATITLNFPPQNRLGPDVSEGLVPAIMELNSRTDTRALLLRAEGPDFSWGGDLRAWQNISSEKFGQNMSEAIKLTSVFEDLPFPTIVAVQGHCRGGGFELALRGDIIIASDDAIFGHSEATIGVFSFLGGAQRVADRVGRGRALQWAYTAEMIEAEMAMEIGLINDLVPRDQLDETAKSWTERLAKGPTLAHAAHKILLNAWSNGGIQAADNLMPDMAARIHASADLQDNLDEAVKAIEAGQPRPAFTFVGK